jgi:hypothetical protein
MNDDFIKYLKYKKKYLSLREAYSYNLSGGSNSDSTNIILCGTHNNRLLCFFNNLTNNKLGSFNNCIIIRCFKINNETHFEMIYEGEMIENNDVCANLLQNKGCWNKDSFNEFFIGKTFDITIPNNTEIFLIRHALGVHNKMSIMEKIFNHKKDSELDVIGYGQAERAGKFLKSYLENKNINKIYFMASPLVRTQQTIGIIMNNININNNIYIVPCTHELNTHNSKCYTSLLELIPVPSNTPLCRNGDNGCDILRLYPGNIKLVWKYYEAFYNSNKKCKDTNMITEIIKIYNNLNM